MVSEREHEEFSVTYEGEALENNTMDVRDLAPALLSLGQAFERANSLLNGNRADVNLHIKALTPGSFDIALVLSQYLQGASVALSFDWLTSAISLREFLIGTPTGVIGLVMLIKSLKGKKPKQTETSDGIVFEAENVKITISKEVALLFNDKPIRDQIEGVVRPLKKSGISKVTFSQNKKVLDTVDNSEVDFFSSLNDGDNVTEYVIPRQRLLIASLKFKRGKWQLNDGEKTRWYAMDDQTFIQAIHNGRRFGESDILICEVLMVQQLQPNGQLKMSYSVKRVINHIAPGEQLRLK